MTLETPQIPEKEFISTFDYQKEVEHFIDTDQETLLGEERTTQAKTKALETEEAVIEQIKTGGKEITYNKYKKSLFIENEQTTLGQIVASRHFEENFQISEVTAKTFEGKKLLQTFLEYKTRDALTSVINKDLATLLAEKTRKEDMFKSKAYQAIAEREGEESEQLGVIAEKMMQGIAEMISLDRPDLHLEIRPANAFQDVEEKIDFIISTRSKKRGVGVETKDGEYEEKNFGIQFTVNKSKTAHKLDQIEKAKGRTTNMDDILLVTIDQNTIRTALANWEKNGKKIHGPWNYMPTGSKKKVIETLFSGVLKPEEIESLQKNF